jgi:uncharacterized MAPEG superfamily protein
MPIDAMPIEVRVLAYAALLQVLQIVVYAIPANLQLGPSYTAGPRDEPRMPQGIAGRLQRALNKHFEGLILFTIAVVVVVLGNGSSDLTANAAWAYLAARVLYVPAYVSGIYLLRSLIWAVGFFATLAMLLATLL